MFVCRWIFKCIAHAYIYVHTHTHTHVHIHIYVRAPTSYSNKYSWVDAFDCVWLLFYFLLLCWFTFQAKSTHRSNSLSFEDQIKWKQKQATTVSKRTLYRSRHIIRERNESVILCVLRLFYSAVSAKRDLSLTHSLSVCCS